MFKNRIAQIDEFKKKIDGLRPLSANQRERLKEYFCIGLTYSSNALEGNTLTETETKVIIEDGLTIGGKTIREHLEVLGHKKAFDEMYLLAQKTEVSESDILKLHCLFYFFIDQNQAGTYRKEHIMVSGTDFKFPKPQELQQLMQNFVHELSTMAQTKHPVEVAAWAHVQLVTIHPFVDGNGRTARLLMNLLLMQKGHCITIIPPIMRAEYLALLRKANYGNHEEFIIFISEMVYESHKEYLRLLEN